MATNFSLIDMGPFGFLRSWQRSVAWRICGLELMRLFIVCFGWECVEQGSFYNWMANLFNSDNYFIKIIKKIIIGLEMVTRLNDFGDFVKKSKLGSVELLKGCWYLGEIS